MMKDSCDQTLSQLVGKKGAVLTDLERFIDNQPAVAAHSDLRKKTPEVLAALREGKKSIKDSMAKVDLLLPDGMIKLENDIQAAAQHVEGVKTAAKDHMDGLRFRDESDKHDPEGLP